MKGMEMMLQSMGIDPAKIMADFNSLKIGVTNELQAINKHLSTIEKQNTEILEGQKSIEGKQDRAWQKLMEWEAQLQTVPQQQPIQLVQPNH